MYGDGMVAVTRKIIHVAMGTLFASFARHGGTSFHDRPVAAPQQTGLHASVGIARSSFLATLAQAVAPPALPVSVVAAA